MEKEKIIDLLQKLPDSEFNKVFASPWSNFPSELVRDEMVRRLKLMKGLSLDERQTKYREIIKRYQVAEISNNMDNLICEVTGIDGFSMESLQRGFEKSKIHEQEISEHQRQLRNLHEQLEDQFEGKAKPGDWRPEGTELCPVCVGNGKGADARMCGKCSGRGFIRRQVNAVTY
jgi:DnaJ-class molecular chaperone